MVGKFERTDALDVVVIVEQFRGSRVELLLVEFPVLGASQECHARDASWANRASGGLQMTSR